MKRGGVYTLRAATLGILSIEDSNRLPVMIPTGATIPVVDGNVSGNRFVNIDWQGQTTTIFAVDLRVRDRIMRQWNVVQESKSSPGAPECQPRASIRGWIGSYSGSLIAPIFRRFVMRLAYAFLFVLTAVAQVLTLQDGTPVRLRLSRTVSSSNAHVGETVDFEVTEPVINRNYVVIQKGAVALGRVTKVDTKRRFGRAGTLELSIDSVRLSDGRTVPLRASPEKGPSDMSGARVAASIAASPVLVWVKGKEVSFEKGTETTAYVSGDARIDEFQPRTGSDSTADRRAAPDAVLVNADIVQMQKAGLSEAIILSKIGTSTTNFNTGTQDLIRLKEAGVNDNIINAIVQKSDRR